MSKTSKNISWFIWAFVLIGTGLASCKKQLDVGDPNAPTLSGNVNSETGLIALAQGSVYLDGFGNGYFATAWAYNELLADNIGTDLSGQSSTIGVPDYWIVDGHKIVNASPSLSNLRANNTRAATAAYNNPFYFQWADMYALINACNTVLTQVDAIEASADSATRRNIFRAWCYWWKGYAYAAIGTQYYSGLIVDPGQAAGNQYVLHDQIIAESDRCLHLAAACLQSVTDTGAYDDILAKLIPDFCQTGKGAPPTPDMWIRNINTLLARNILLNRLSPFVNGDLNATIQQSALSAMTNEDWNKIVAYASTGIRQDDYVFTGRSPAINNFFAPNAGTVATSTCFVNTSEHSFKVSERFIQSFSAGDQRLLNNFNTATTFFNDKTFTTRYSLMDGGLGMPGVYAYASLTPGDYELLIAGSYEENELMLAEANIRSGNTDPGLSHVDAVRLYQGAGLAPVTGTGLSAAQAMQILTSERRIALIFRGISFYDSRRWGWAYSVERGGGTYQNRLLETDGSVHDQVIFSDNFLDYWDLPADQTLLSPPSAGSAAVINPNF